MFTTPVFIQNPVKQIGYTHKIMFTGSCFSENVGSKMSASKFQVQINPFGILYNPISLSGSIMRLLKGNLFRKEELSYDQGRFFSFSHHGKFDHPSADVCLKNINASLLSGHEFLKKASFLFLSLGSAFVYQHQTAGIVGNCHKMDSRKFRQALLSVEECTESLETALRPLLEINPEIQCIFTVSPVLYVKEGAHFNRLSKATLLLAAESLCHKFPRNTSYFPAYEIMQDELRDYRYYAADMIHPSETALEYIWGKFSKSWILPEANVLAERIGKLSRSLMHRPLYSGSAEYRQFLENLLKETESLQAAHPELNFEEEKQRIHSLLFRGISPAK